MQVKLVNMRPAKVTYEIDRGEPGSISLEGEKVVFRYGSNGKQEMEISLDILAYVVHEFEKINP